MQGQLSTLGLVGLALSMGCGELGDRAVGGCPADEICNVTTPEGLVFFGTGTIATGGTATVTFAHAHSVRGPDGVYRYPAFDQPFVATVDDEAIMNIAAQGAARVDLRANAVGESRLRIEDIDGQLFDRLTIKTETIAYQTVLGNGLLFVDPATPIAFASGTVEFSVELFGSTGTGLIDTSAQVTADVPITPVASTASILSDSLSQHYAFEALQPQRVKVTVKAGDRAPLDLALDVVASIDRVATTKPSYTVAARDGAALICFAGYNGLRAVANLQWTFTVDGAVRDASWSVNCVAISVSASHIPVVKATARGVSGGATIAVIAAPKRSQKWSERADARSGAQKWSERADARSGASAVGDATLLALRPVADNREVAGDRARAAENAKPPAEASGPRTQLVKN